MNPVSEFLRHIQITKSGEKTRYLKNITKTFNDMITSVGEDIKLHQKELSSKKRKYDDLHHEHEELIRKTQETTLVHERLHRKNIKLADENNELQKSNYHKRQTQKKIDAALAQVTGSKLKVEKYDILTEENKRLRDQVNDLHKKTKKFKDQRDAYFLEIKSLKNEEDETDDGEFSEDDVIDNSQLMQEAKL